MKIGDRFRIIWKCHWGYGRKFTCSGRPHVSVRCIDLGRMVEFISSGPDHNGEPGKSGKHVVPLEWCAPELAPEAKKSRRRVSGTQA